MKKIDVSVVCTTYNHRPYIRQALESFIKQKTDFEYEIVVHDDASSDGTADIVAEYAERFPELITVILQKENQYSQGVQIQKEFILPRVKGKYIAFCEGDDYFTCDNKLQMQFDYMELNPACGLCVHQVGIFDNAKGKKKGVCTPCNVERDYSADEIILGGGGLFGTSSMFCRRDDALEFQAWKPACSPVGDYPSMIFYSTKGSVHYMPEEMSCYRVGIPGSWSTRMESSDYLKKRNHIDMIAKMLDEIDKKTGYAHSDAICRHKLDNELNFAMGAFETKKIMQIQELKSLYRSLAWTKRMRYRLKSALHKCSFVQ